MNKELQDKAWDVLPNEFREELKKMYNDLLNEHITPDIEDSVNNRMLLLEEIFSYHNLTSDAENPANVTSKPKFKVGDYVTVHFENGKRMVGHINEVLLNGAYDVDFGDGCMMHNVTEACIEPYHYAERHVHVGERGEILKTKIMKTIEEINALIKELQPNEGQVSDGYHTFDELYDFRREYNAALVNTHAYPCHKSLRHSDGELCFGGGWFIVMINLPTGQISNHYVIKYWIEFNCEERECAEPWDGHTDKDVLIRLKTLNIGKCE